MIFISDDSLKVKHCPASLSSDLELCLSCFQRLSVGFILLLIVFRGIDFHNFV